MIGWTNAAIGGGGALALQSLTIVTPPDKVSYGAGEAFNPAGMVVTGDLGEGVTVTVTEYTYSPETIAEDTTGVTITATVAGVTKSAVQAITVAEEAVVTFTGTGMVTREITSSGTAYKLYEIPSSGTLNISGRQVTADIWLCGGGSGGLTSGKGGAGAYCAQVDSVAMEGDYVITIGAGTSGGTSKVEHGGETIATAAGVYNSENGGSGGGGRGGRDANGRRAGTGDGKSKIPFGDTVNFTSIPCAGGGGWGYSAYGVGEDDPDTYANGGNGGSNGADGTDGGDQRDGTGYVNGVGGATGGGKGYKSGSQEHHATYYGSGGGGGNGPSSVGRGYSGVVFIRIAQA